MLLYRSLIRSKLDYACVVYDSACVSSKRILDTVHNNAARVATGAFRTSPVSSILADAHEPPLALRRCLLSMRYACKLRQFPEHPTYAYVFSRRVLALFENDNTARAVPLCVRVCRLMQEANIAPRHIARVSPTIIPPWELVAPTIDTSLSGANKDDVLPMEFRAKSLELISSYTNHQHVYTDGSKSDTGVGCAFVHGSTTRTFGLPAAATVFSAELVAIHKALSFIEVVDDGLHVVFTDSLSSLLALRDFNKFHPFLQDILVLLTNLHRRGKSVSFCWIPSHFGIAGNERADQAAKRASRLRNSRFLPLPASDFFAVCSASLRRKWQEEWENSGSSKLRVIKPVLMPWSSSFRASRREEVQLCRLRIGHTLATHRYLLCGGCKPRCSRCGEILTVAHVLVSCRCLVPERARFLGSASLSLRDLLNDHSTHIDQVLRFLNHINFRIIFSRTM